MNAPDRFELFIIPDGVKKITYTYDPKIDNAATFVIQKEDHSLGNLIRYSLLKEPQVIFAGYKMPHPLEHVVVLKVMTTKETKPEAMVAKAINDSIAEVSHLRAKFVEELGRVRTQMAAAPDKAGEKDQDHEILHSTPQAQPVQLRHQEPIVTPESSQPGVYLPNPNVDMDF